jgi:hypothetical protein
VTVFSSWFVQCDAEPCTTVQTSDVMAANKSDAKRRWIAAGWRKFNAGRGLTPGATREEWLCPDCARKAGRS